MLKFIILFSFIILSCARKEDFGTRIVGGHAAQKNEFPWAARLIVQTNNNANPVCGAVILSQDWVMTAAHCISGIPLADIFLIAGDHDLRIKEESEQLRKVVTYIIHALYKPSSQDDKSYDFALVKVSEPFVYTESVKNVTLPDLYVELNLTHTFTVVGWGLTSRLYEDISPDVLQKVELQILPNESCMKYYENITMISKSMICAVEGYKTPCKGDSGSGLVDIQVDKDGNKSHVLFGIVSFGPVSCNEESFERPAVFGNVPFVYDWINLHVYGTVVTTPSTTSNPCFCSCEQIVSEIPHNPTSTSHSSKTNASVAFFFILLLMRL